MRYSKQRETILKALQNNPVHPAADYLYNLLKKDNPALSLGTVYRNLSLLADCGFIKRIKGLDNKERFDHNNFDHAHIICNTCGSVRDIMIPPALAAQLAAVKNKPGFKACSCDLLLRGTCKICTDKIKRR